MKHVRQRREALIRINKQSNSLWWYAEFFLPGNVLFDEILTLKN